MKALTLKNNGMAWTLLPLLCSVVSPVFAIATLNDTAELKVAGTISPSSCTVTLGTEGERRVRLRMAILTRLWHPLCPVTIS